MDSSWDRDKPLMKMLPSLESRMYGSSFFSAEKYSQSPRIESFVVLTSTIRQSATGFPSTAYFVCGAVGRMVSVPSVNAMAPKGAPSGPL